MSIDTSNDLLEDLWRQISKKIAVIDDDDDIVNLVKAYLLESFENVEVVEAFSGGDGLKLIKDELPDLIILDVKMPDISGLELLEILKRKHSDIIDSTPVIMLTFMNDVDTVKGAIGHGTSEYLLKPFEKETLISRVQKLLDL